MKKFLFLPAIACLVSCTQESVAPQPPIPSTTNDPPVISLSCFHYFTHPLNTAFNIPQGFANDTEDGDITHLLTVTSSVDIYNTGIYPVVYSVMDSDNNAVSDTVMVEVITGTALFQGVYEIAHDSTCHPGNPFDWCTIYLDSTVTDGILINNFDGFGVNFTIPGVINGSAITFASNQSLGALGTLLWANGTVISTSPVIFSVNYAWNDGVTTQTCSSTYTHQ